MEGIYRNKLYHQLEMQIALLIYQITVDIAQDFQIQPEGCIGGGLNPSAPNDIIIDYHSSTGNAVDFGNLIQSETVGGAASSVRGIIAGGTN